MATACKTALLQLTTGEVDPTAPLLKDLKTSVEQLQLAIYEEIDPEEGFCRNATTPHRYRLYAKLVPCSRCGGSKLCPECTGSGLSRTAEPIRPCWFCAKTKTSSKGPGVCPQCDEDGFETLGNSR